MSHHDTDTLNPRPVLEPGPDSRKMIGATGEFPDGKLCPENEWYGIGTSRGFVVVDFGKSVRMLVLKPDQARAIAEGLISKADESDAVSKF